MSRGTKKLANRSGAKRRLADARAAILYHGVAVRFFEHGYFCRIPVRHAAIDADGAPFAYGPSQGRHDEDGIGLDSLTSAGYPTRKKDPIDDDWRDVLVPDLANPATPFLKADGHYISKTSLFDGDATSDATPGKYVDASLVSYIVMPQLWIDRLGMQLGDLCLLWRSNKMKAVVAIVADTCPVDEPLGEISIAAARALGSTNLSPRDGPEFARGGTIRCVMFAGTRPHLEWPIADAFVQSFKDELLNRLQGLGFR
jgi:hypothetical protein